MKLSKKLICVMLCMALSAVSVFAGGRGQAEFPSRDVAVVAPWGAGGVTDLIVRSLAEPMQAELGVNMPIINMGGAGGSIGMHDVFVSPRNGYRILGTSMTSIATVRVMGLADIAPAQWHAWNAAFTPNVIAVRGDSPFQTLQDLIDAMAANPGAIPMGSAGPGSSGHVGGVVFASGAGTTFNHIPYEGGNPAIIATLGGEVEFTAQVLAELIDHLRSGDLRALATLATEDITITGAGGQSIVLPSVLNYLPNLAPMLPLGASIGFFVPRDTPMDIVEALDRAYFAAVQSASFRSFADDRGVVVVGQTRQQTDAYLVSHSSVVNWVLADMGMAVVPPDQLGIPRP
ncbi:MAG: tripartite tricarboxylate transporter substrate binding protein [Spirochaetes bacterium]|nr:tripartite tricarboxylate transporter substrate binding protein [Spirochaetota bacterium]